MIHLRGIKPQDLPFLKELYGSTREEELRQTGWNAQQIKDFIAFQFHAQHEHYTKHYEGSQFDIIELDGLRAGRLYVARWTREIRIVDIALMPQFRGRGIGTDLLKRLIVEAEQSGKVLSIHVELFNPAMRLYKRLGFQKISEYGIYHLLERSQSEPIFPIAEISTGSQASPG